MRAFVVARRNPLTDSSFAACYGGLSFEPLTDGSGGRGCFNLKTDPKNCGSVSNVCPKPVMPPSALTDPARVVRQASPIRLRYTLILHALSLSLKDASVRTRFPRTATASTSIRTVPTAAPLATASTLESEPKNNQLA